MPAWGGRIPEYQIWQIIAYVKSMNGEQLTSATPSRLDTIEPNPQNIVNRVPGKTK
jgi:cytochrome c oxidase cbb3-type subunit 3